MSSFWLTITSTTIFAPLLPSSILIIFALMATPVAPFYEPGAPPLPVPLLLAHTELADPLAPNLIDNEPLTKSGTLRPNKTITPTLHMPKGHTSTSHYPVPRNARSPTPKMSSINHSPDSSDLDSELDELSDSDASSDSDDAKIPKPQGEAGRPGRGGYNLAAALDWNSKQYNKLKVGIYLSTRSRRY
jgi:hypothetical protein